MLPWYGENYDFNASVDGLDGLSYSGHGRFRGIGVAPYVRRMYVYTTEREYYVSDFGFNFDARSIARLGDISIGVYYAF